MVFEVRSGNGSPREGDPGIAGVLVSNGRDVTQTDADGRWTLPVAVGDSVFVIKPPHWTTPIGPGNASLWVPLGTDLGDPRVAASY
jgi:hypothetical protein